MEEKETSGKNGDKEKPAQGKVREVECVVFVPATPGSRLRDTLQKEDDNMSQALNAPSLRFVEKGGTTIKEKVGQSDPWKGDTFCQREYCLHCQGRYVLAEEEDADNADQDRGKVHLLTISGFFPSWAAYKTASLLDGSKVRFLKIS